MSKFNLTEAQIVAAMIESDGGDYYKAQSRLLAEHDRNNILPATVAEVSPWEIVPTEAEVRNLMADMGTTDFAYAQAELKNKLTADAVRLSRVIPDAAKEICRARQEANEAIARAENLSSERQAILDGLETSIYALGNVRLKIKKVKSLELTNDQAQSLAFSAFDAFLDMQSASDSPERRGAWRSACEGLTYRAALNQFLDGYTAKLESAAENILKQIHEQAAAAGVEMAGFLKLLQSERGKRPSAALAHDMSLYEGLF